MTSLLTATRGSDFAALSRQIKAENLLDRQHGPYFTRIVITFGAYVAAWVTFAMIGDSWYQSIVAVALGLAFTQVAFLGHDGGHQQIWKSKKTNDLLGLIAGNLCVGISYAWWVDKHNRHHAKPNYEGFDPDISDGVLAFTRDQVAARSGSVSRFVTRHQAWLFFPLLTLEGVSLHVAGVQALISGKTRRKRGTEIAMLALHALLYVAAVLLVLSPVKALVFIAIHQAIFGVYMGCSFAPNHKGMPTITPGQDVDFLRRQVLTSRNVRGGWFTDQLLGGLNYQVEHHLFPNMPRSNLRKAQPLVQAYCDRLQIRYTETSLIGSYAVALRHLHNLGAPLRVRPALARHSTS